MWEVHRLSSRQGNTAITIKGNGLCKHDPEQVIIDTVVSRKLPDELFGKYTLKCTCETQTIECKRMGRVYKIPTMVIYHLIKSDPERFVHVSYLMYNISRNAANIYIRRVIALYHTIVLWKYDYDWVLKDLRYVGFGAISIKAVRELMHTGIAKFVLDEDVIDTIDNTDLTVEQEREKRGSITKLKKLKMDELMYIRILNSMRTKTIVGVYKLHGPHCRRLFRLFANAIDSLHDRETMPAELKLLIINMAFNVNFKHFDLSILNTTD
jgi:hypothetical protein